MNFQDVLTQLRTQSHAISALVSGLSVEDARWKPAPESWSLLEVLNHLVDEEIYDFRAHLDHILHTPNQSWPKIDPAGWVIQRDYNGQDLEETLIRFTAEREKSLIWLTGLTTPNWDSAVVWPWGTVTAGDMLAAWLAHDLLHVRQLVELRYQITATNSQPYQVDYAGKW